MSQSRTKSRLRAVAENPVLNVGIGALLVLTSLTEIIIGLEEEFTSVGAHHGVLLFGVLHLLRTIPDVFEGLKLVDDGEKNREGLAE